MAYPALKALRGSRDADLWIGFNIPNIPGASDVLSLSANTAKTYTIPTGCNKILFQAQHDLWIDPNTTAVIPTGDNINGNSPLFFPAGQQGKLGVKGVGEISIISASSGLVQISVYS